MSGKILAFLGRVNWFAVFFVSAAIHIIPFYYYRSDYYKTLKCEQYGYVVKIDKNFRIYCDVEGK